MAGPPFKNSQQKVDWEDGSSSYVSGSKVSKLKTTPRPTAGEGPAFPGSSPGKPKSKYGVGTGVISDKRTVKQKLADAQARQNLARSRMKIPKGSSVAGSKVDG